jgi:hypothetical protein
VFLVFLVFWCSDRGDVAFVYIEDYMTYDELQLSALIGCSVPTYFINRGDRYNGGSHGGCTF